MGEARLSAYEAFCGDAAKYEAPQMRYEAKPFQASCFFALNQGKKMAEREGFEPSIILLVKSRLKRCFIPPFERKFLKFQHYMALLSA